MVTPQYDRRTPRARLGAGALVVDRDEGEVPERLAEIFSRLYGSCIVVVWRWYGGTKGQHLVEIEPVPDDEFVRDVVPGLWGSH
jgi:hypothetical protein